MRLSRQHQEERLLWSVKDWNRMMFLTATMAEEEHDPKVISKRFTAFTKALKRWHVPTLRAVRVIQKHPGGHGWHIHALLDRFIPAKILLAVAADCGLGRMDFRMVSGEDRGRAVRYVVRYISRDMRERWKHPELKGVRLITASGSLRCEKRWWVRLQDLTIEDTGRESRTLLQRLMEINGIIRLPTTTRRPPPMRMTDLLMAAPQAVLDQWVDACNANPQRYGRMDRIYEFPKPVPNYWQNLQEKASSRAAAAA